ncbi:glutamine synthetase family protein [Mycolicibacterium diernhoferi]|uniref:Glutamate--ammonia ligase n=1 Tax=Mycolicibacterium diernhoferi TaxID=1801 RepID=A0A1Q4HJ76_9MYCO|nr:glutamine synthetase family protein [Mycolicibacterium diernhoferi]OJZ67599.1 glutamate--ammonia ligase [Mycolicibacterium diernhoferi]OPE55398.1 glutamate--ammonia ligase [Mycolicibacterium diernhoferi]PEG55868.1 glutamine synthetase [Mycolicibacterium diernhoferi]QYL25250.1 glutamine synthetase family protein [Mycolicibacterium diernhoferi]
MTNATTGAMNGNAVTITTVEAARAFFDRHQVSTVQFGMTDLDGQLRGKFVPADVFLDSIATRGSSIPNIVFGWDIEDTLMDCFSVSGWHTGFSDVVLMPDLTTLRPVPWEPGHAFVLCDVVHTDGSEVSVVPRTVLARQVARAAALGYRVTAGYELEFYLYRETPETAAAKGYRHLTPAAPGNATFNLNRQSTLEPVIGAIREGMRACDIPILASNTEYGAGQIEINIEHADVLTTADRVAIYKNGVRRIAEQHGYLATFMAKVATDAAGSSGHIHQSMQPLDTPTCNAMWDGDGPSTLMRQAVAGQLATMSDFTALYCPTVNSYKRRVPASWSPVSAVWGNDNRTAALRVIARDEATCRMENRVPGADANPYLALAACVAGVLHGVENRLQPPAPVLGDAYQDDGVPLPRSLAAAVETLAQSTTARTAFGDEFVDHYLASRIWERDRHREQVSDWETGRYFSRV